MGPYIILGLGYIEYGIWVHIHIAIRLDMVCGSDCMVHLVVEKALM